MCTLMVTYVKRQQTLANVALVLHVDQRNLAAYRLYTRLGFSGLDGTAQLQRPYMRMSWQGDMAMIEVN